jgi:nitrile hydratase
MNGVHDMGGMHGMGPVPILENEPVFPQAWEGRVFALRRAVSAWRKWNSDASRHEIELLPAAEYLRLDYYERQLAAFVELMIKRGVITREEAERGTPDAGTPKASPVLTAEKAAALVHGGASTGRSVAVSPGFPVGQQVRARNLNPAGHTRLPRYARGKTGMVERDHGVFVFPDSNARFLGENPQHVYSVRFTARELWGSEAPARDSVYLDLWEDYLEPA